MQLGNKLLTNLKQSTMLILSTRVVENWLKGIYIINPIAMLWDSCKQVE